MKPIVHPRGLFSGRPVRGVSPFLCHVCLWTGVGIFVFSSVNAALRDLALAAPEVFTVNAGKVDSANEGRRIHLTGVLGSASPARDPQFGAVGAAACLRRTEETRTDRIRPRRPRRPDDMLDVWTPRPGGPVFSNAFGVTLGAFRVDTADLAKTGPWTPLELDGELLRRVAAAMPGHSVRVESGWIVFTSTAPLAEGAVFPPAFRVKVEQIPFGVITIVGKQEGEHVIPVAVSLGAHPASAVLRRARDSARVLGLLLCLFGAGLSFAGLHLLRQARDLTRLYGRHYFDR